MENGQYSGEGLRGAGVGLNGDGGGADSGRLSEPPAGQHHHRLGPRRARVAQVAVLCIRYPDVGMDGTVAWGG